MKTKFDTICIGAAIVDIPLQPVSKDIFDTPSYPLERIAMTTGGDAINECTILSRLGNATALMGIVGKDAAGDFVLEECRKEKINIDGIKRDQAIDTSINIGLVTDDGERTFVTNRNGSLWNLSLKHLDLARLKEARLLSLASIFNSPLLDGKSLEHIFKCAKEEGLIICADMISPRCGESLEDIRTALSYVDYFFPNYEEAKQLTGKSELDQIADVFLDCGVKHVVIKNGKKGCFLKYKDEAYTVPAVPGIQAIDTIGAGDNFVAGFISALLDGKNVETCAKFANATAAIAVQSVGATSGVQDKLQVLARYEAYTGGTYEAD